jgi:hypothetical protein
MGKETRMYMRGKEGENYSSSMPSMSYEVASIHPESLLDACVGRKDVWNK